MNNGQAESLRMVSISYRTLIAVLKLALCWRKTIALSLSLLLTGFCFKVYCQTVTFSTTLDIDDGSDVGWSVIVLDDGYLISGGGYASSLNGWTAIKILKTNLNGNVLWEKIYGKKTFAYYGGLSGSFTKTLNGGYALGGGIRDSVTNNGDVLLLTFDFNADTIWTKTFGGSQFDACYQGRQTLDGGYAMFGQTTSYGDIDGDYYLIKVDSLGNFQWQKTYGGSGIEKGLTIEITSDNGFILGGVSTSNCPGVSCARLIKTDSAGNVQWNKTYGSSGEDWAGQTTLCSDGGYLLWGGMDTIINLGDTRRAEFVTKLDSSGNIKWRTFFNSPDESTIWQLRELSDRSIVFTGEKEIPVYDRDGGWSVKLDSEGNILWERQYFYEEYPGAFPIGCSFQGDFQPTPDRGFIVTGVAFNQIDSFNYNQDVWLLKLDSNGCLGPDSCGITVGINNPLFPKPESASIFIYPNPIATSALISIKAANLRSSPISFTLFDLSGKILQTHDHTLNEYGYIEFIFNRNQLPAGIFIYQVVGKGQLLGKGKMIIQ